MNFERVELESVDGTTSQSGARANDGTLTGSIQSGVPQSDNNTKTTSTTTRTFGREVLRYIALCGMSLIIGALVAVALATIIDTWVVLVIGVILGAAVLYRQDTTRGTIGTGLYVLALVILLVPIGQYATSIFSVEGSQGTIGPLSGFEGILGLVIGLIIAVVVAVVLAAIGYAFNLWAPASV